MKILKTSQKSVIEEIKKALRRGEIIVLPTDTVYALVCDARNKTSVRRIFKIKKRVLEKPIGIFVRDIKMAKKFALLNFEKTWEGKGKVTVVLKRRKDCDLPKILFGGKETIGLRIPDYKLIHLIFGEINFPLAQTSANISGKPANTKIKEVLGQFRKQKEKPDLVINAGNLRENKPSTVVDFTTKSPKILREGEVKI